MLLELVEPEIGKHHRHDGDQPDHRGGREHRAESETQRHEVKPDQSPLFLLLIGHVHRIEDRQRAAVRAPEGDAKAHEESDAKRRAAAFGEALDAIGDEIEGAGRKQS